MKYCKKCKVNVNHQHEHCPLCGSYLNDNDNNGNCAIYQHMDEHINRPIVSVEQKSNFLQSKIYKILLVLCAVCIAINMLTSTTPWSAYVIIGTVLILFCVIFPIGEKSKIQNMIRTDIVVIALSAVALELTITRMNFMWISIYNILPWIFLAAIVLVDFLIIFRDFAQHGLFSTLLFVTIINCIPQIIDWIQISIGYDKYVGGHIVMLFIIGLLNIAIVTIVCSKSIKEEMQSRLSI